MGLFLHVILFPGGDEAKWRAALAREAEDQKLSVRPEECLWHQYEKGPAVQLNDYANGWETAGRLSDGMDGPVLLAYIYDDDFWGYDLWEDGMLLDQFASVHDYFGENQPPNKAGDARIVGSCFGVEPEAIDRYLIPWEEAMMDARAYEGDRSTIGDSWQMADFLNALGFDYDQLCPPEPEKEPNQPPPASAGKEANRPAPVQEEPVPVPGPRAKRSRTTVDTPILPNVLTSRTYTLQRVLDLGEDYGELAPLVEYGKYQEAISRLTEATQTAPEEAGLYLVRAFCWKQLEGLSGRSRKLEVNRDLAKALELEPDNVMALRGRSSLTTTSARYPQQIQDLTRLAELDLENRDLYLVSRAYFRHWLKDDDGARVDLEEVLDRGEIWTVDLVYLCKELGLPGF